MASVGGSQGLWSDPLTYVLPHSDALYQQALQERGRDLLLHPAKYSSFEGLCSSLG
jgi:hypothetical protein